MSKRLSPETKAAVNKYGPMVRGLAKKRYGISGRKLLAKLVAGESGDNPKAVSPVGAKGRTQFMPSSRAIAKKKYGVDPHSGRADDEVKAAALHLQGKINGSKGLEGYNPGDPNYPKYILAQKVGKLGDVPSGKRTASAGRKKPKSSRSGTRSGVDFEAAAVDALMNRREGGSLLKRIETRVDSGEYTRSAPAAKPKSGKDYKLKDGGGKLAKPTKGKYAGSGRAIRKLTRGLPTQTTSTKRDTVHTASGNVSDHAKVNKKAYAHDEAGSVEEMDAAALKVARRLGIKGYKKGQPLNTTVVKNGYRYQVLYRTNVGGNHYDHVHVGAKRVA